jgi:hypothetical protein
MSTEAGVHHGSASCRPWSMVNVWSVILTFTWWRSEQKTQKWRRVFTFYSVFGQAFSGGNLCAYGDDKVCGFRFGMHVRWLGGAVIHYHATPPCLSACVESSFSYLSRENQNIITDPSLFSNTICTYPVSLLELPEQLDGPTCLFISLYCGMDVT